VTEILVEYKAPLEAEGDLTLVHATKRGSVAAFEKIVRRYDRKLLRIARSVTHNREEAEDAVQEAFSKTDSAFCKQIGAPCKCVPSLHRI
jgi:DNA-directed RNA polymerase specialized sigma24 family protein